MTITALPVAPDASDPSTFSAKASTFVAALPTLVSEINNTIQIGFSTWTLITSAHSAVNGENLLANTSSAAISVSLPVGTANYQISVADYLNTFATHNLTIVPNGTDKIEGVAANYVLSASGDVRSLIYIDAVVGWKVFSGNASGVGVGIFMDFLSQSIGSSYVGFVNSGTTSLGTTVEESLLTVAEATKYLYGTTNQIDVAAGTPGQLTLSLSNTLQLPGSTVDNRSLAGVVGEVISSTVASGSAVSLTTATTANVTSISLTEGNWEISGQADFTMSNGVSVVQYVSAGSSSTSAALAGQDTYGTLLHHSTSTYPVDSTVGVPSRPYYVSAAAAPLTMYLVVRSAFTTGPVSAYGTIRARRTS